MRVSYAQFWTLTAIAAVLLYIGNSMRTPWLSYAGGLIAAMLAWCLWPSSKSRKNPPGDKPQA